MTNLSILVVTVILAVVMLPISAKNISVAFNRFVDGERGSTLPFLLRFTGTYSSVLWLAMMAIATYINLVSTGHFI